MSRIADLGVIKDEIEDLRSQAWALATSLGVPPAPEAERQAIAALLSHRERLDSREAWQALAVIIGDELVRDVDGRWVEVTDHRGTEAAIVQTRPEGTGPALFVIAEVTTAVELGEPVTAASLDRRYRAWREALRR